jgi:hypothetical protein
MNSGYQVCYTIITLNSDVEWVKMDTPRFSFVTLIRGLSGNPKMLTDCLELLWPGTTFKGDALKLTALDATEEEVYKTDVKNFV